MNNLKIFIVIIISMSTSIFSLPANGNKMIQILPDGSEVIVKIYGDEFYKRVESIDGYTLCKDSTGWIYYANLSDDSSSYTCSKYKYMGQEISRNIHGLEKHIEISEKSKLEIINYQKSLMLGNRYYRNETISRPSPKIIGGTILIDFSDDTATFTVAQIDDLMNKIGYSDLGNKSSVREYFLNMSNHQFDYENKIIGYYRAQYTKDYYENNNLKLVLIEEALRGVDNQFDFSQLTINIKTIKAINILYAGACRSAFGQGLWPHAGQYRYETNDGVNVASYQMAAIDTGLSIGPIAHENAHMLLGLSDLYDSRNGSHGVGYYALMGYGCLLPTPTAINAFYRNKLGWEIATDITNSPEGTVFKHVPNSTSSFAFYNSNNSREHFYIESRTRTGNYIYQPDEGLMIWHVDEWSFFQNPDMTPNSHYYVSLEQADGRFDLEKGVNAGDSTDLYKNSLFSEFNESTTPNSNWWKDGNSGLEICNVSSIGDTISFTIGKFQTSKSLKNSLIYKDLSISYNDNLNHLHFKNLFTKLENVEIFNSVGQKVLEHKLDSETKSVKLSRVLPKGIYYVKLKAINGLKIPNLRRFKFMKI